MTATVKRCNAQLRMRVIRHIVMLAGITTFPKTAIFNESSTLMFSAVTKSTPVIFSQVALKLMRILHDKNYQNWSSGFGEKCLVLFLQSDCYSVCGVALHLFIS